MSPLTQAISQGFSPDQILQYLIRQFPKHSKSIQKAITQGFSAEQILKYLTRGKKGLEFEGELTEHEKTRKTDTERQRNIEKNIGKGALALGGAALGAYGLAQREQSILPEVLPALQGVAQPKEDVEIDLTPRIAHQPRLLEQQPPNQLIQQAQNPQPSNPQLPNSPQIQAQTPQLDFGQVLDQLGVKGVVDGLREANNSPEVISKLIRYKVPKAQLQQIESQLQTPIDQIIQGYLVSAPLPETMQEKIDKGVPFGQKGEKISEKEISQQNGFKDLIESGKKKFDEHMNAPEIPEKPKNRELKLQRGSSVLLPDGNIGEIEDVKQGIAKVKVGDKFRNKKLDELMESPKEAANAALELIKSFTPENLRSAHHALNTYDPITRSAQFLFHNGEGYVVEDISPEEYEKLSNEIEEAKTSGESKIGAWATGAGSRGSAYQKIVKNLKKPYRKIQVGYNLFKEFQRLINEKE